MLDTILLMKLENYSERKIRRYETFEEYQNKNEILTANINFEYGNGVETTATINTNNTQDTNIYKANYVVVNNRFNELSRWFIMDLIKIRGNQYKILLRRDLIAENIENVLKCDTYVEKGTVPANNNLIYNLENFEANQIKASNYLIENGKPPYIYIYLNKFYKKQKPDGTDVNTLDIENFSLNRTFINANSEIKSALSIISESKKLIYMKDLIIELMFNVEGDTDFSYGLQFDLKGDFVEIRKANYNSNIEIINFNLKSIQDFKMKKFNDFLNYAVLGTNYAPNYKTVKYYYSLSDNYYNVNNELKYFEINYSNNLDVYGNSKDVGKLYYELEKGEHTFDLLNECLEDIKFQNNAIVNLYFNQEEHEIIYKNAENISKLQVKASTKILEMNEKGYQIISTAYDSTGVLSRNEKVKLAQFLVENFGSDYVLDLQLLPYQIQNSNTDEAYYFIEPSNNENIIEKFELLTKHKDTININLKYYSETPYDFYKNVSKTAIDINTKSLCNLTLSRFNSPNFSSSEDFKIQKYNDISTITVDFELKPYQAYIHVNFVSDGQYGENFNDPNGLILNGDFSLTQSTSQWANFQAQNKNYQIMFNRQIQNMEFNNKISTIGDATNIVGNTVKGAIGGGIAGGAKGAIGGGVAGMTGGMSDFILGGKMREEQLDYTQDMFNMNIANIKARPNTITNISTLNNNFKYFPFIEIYRSTFRELQTFKDKIRLNGMTINIIGKLVDFYEKGKYLKGKMIRNDDFEGDSNAFNELSYEINKGFYLMNYNGGD